jgi:hypothetical protein
MALNPKRKQPIVVADPKPAPTPSIIDVCSDPDLFKSWFEKHPESWTA